MLVGRAQGLFAGFLGLLEKSLSIDYLKLSKASDISIFSYLHFSATNGIREKDKI